MTENSTLKLIPNEGPNEERKINLEVVKGSITLSQMIESSAEDEEQPSVCLPIPVEILDKIISFLVYHFDDPIEDIDKYLDDNAIQEMCEWDRHLLEDIPLEKVFALLAIAEYLKIKGLTYVCQQSIDNKIKVLSDEQLKQLPQMSDRLRTLLKSCQK